MSQHTTLDTPFDQYRFPLLHTQRRPRHAAYISLTLSYTHADLPDKHIRFILRITDESVRSQRPPLLDSRISACGLSGVKTVPCSGRIVPAGCCCTKNRRHSLPHKCGIALIRLPCGSASIGSPQQSMRTKVNLQGCTSCDTQATPNQLQVSRRLHGKTRNSTPLFSFISHISVVRN